MLTSMPTIAIDLQRGFDDDEVVVRINGEEKIRRGGVRTKRLLGLAWHTDFDVDEGPVTLEVELPARGITKTLELEPKDALYVGLSVKDDAIEAIVREKKFGYG